MLPKLEFNEHCPCCARNKITVEVFGRSAQETSPPHPGPSIEKAFAQSPRRIPGPNHNCDAMGCPSIGPHILESHGRLPGIDRAEDPPEKASESRPCAECGFPRDPGPWCAHHK